MKVKYIEDIETRLLDKNKIYEVLLETDRYYKIKDETGFEGFYYKHRFEIVEDDSMKNFNWEDFKSGKEAVWCDTEEKAIDFLRECDKQGIKWRDGRRSNALSHWGYFENETVYIIENSKILLGSYSFHKERFQIIKWEIDEIKEFEFDEIISSIKEGDVYEGDLFIIRGKTQGTIEIMSKRTGKVFGFEKGDKYRLQRKEYSFQEAFKAYEEGKEIESKRTEERYKKINDEDMIYDDSDDIWVYNNFRFDLSEIRSAWYINE